MGDPVRANMAGPFYKVTGPNGEAVNGGAGTWHLPVGKRPGKWMPKITDPSPCERGYHLTAVANLLDWVGSDSCVVWVAETRGPVIDAGDKVVVGEARLVARTAWSAVTARLFAADCAERVLPFWEAEFPEDRRPHDAVIVARRYAAGNATDAERDAAWDAARAAAWAAAGTAARAAAGTAAWAAARDAARVAAGAAARVAAWDAAGAAARAAAWDAARAAAWDAAWDAARAAARVAARAAARVAAWDAAWAWQHDRLAYYLSGGA
jgi:hypothetical protein